MKRSLAIVLAGCAGVVAIFASAFLVTRQVCCHQLAAADDLEWLRQEFHLSAAELARVRGLHEGYMPQCAEMCRRIAAKKAELEQALGGRTNVPPEARHLLEELGALRAQCQGAMLQHFVTVSQAMPPEQGRRYLAEMQRLTLGFHEQIEHTMDAPGHAHGSH